MVTKIPELQIDSAEAKALAEPLADLQELYHVDVSDKAMAWGHFLGACGQVYGPRFAVASIRRANTANAAKASRQTPNAEPSPDNDPGASVVLDFTKMGQ